MNYDITELEEVWRKGDGEMPEKLKHVVSAAQEETLLRLLYLSTDAENTIRYNASKNNKTVSEYLSELIMTSIKSTQ